MKTVKLATFIENPDNPQTVTAEDFALLVESLRTMPQTLAASKIAYVTDYTAVDGADLRGQRVVIAGNKRLRALKQLAADHATSATPCAANAPRKEAK
jgi:ParB-like chromosome segregation protein Spo0J